MRLNDITSKKECLAHCGALTPSLGKGLILSPSVALIECSGIHSRGNHLVPWLEKGTRALLWGTRAAGPLKEK
jgi:hypothetical protein